MMATSIVCILLRPSNPGIRTKKKSELTLTQTVTLSGTNVTVKGVSDKFKTVGDKVTGKSYSASNIIVQASTAVA